jgi:hypothetical protein
LLIFSDNNLSKISRRYSGAHTGEKLLDIDYTTTIPNEWNITPKDSVIWQPFIDKPGYYENWAKEGWSQKYNAEGTEWFNSTVEVYSYGYDFMRHPAVSYNHLTDWNGWFRFCAWKKMQSLADSKHMKILNQAMVIHSITMIVNDTMIDWKI